MNGENEFLMKSIYNNFSARLSALIEEKGCTQKELAEYLGVKPQVVSYYATGKNLPLVTGLYKIAKYFNVNTDYLLCLSDVKTTDGKIRQIAESINLSEKAVENLLTITKCETSGNMKEYQVKVINNLISSPIFAEFIKKFTQYLYFINPVIEDIKKLLKTIKTIISF